MGSLHSDPQMVLRRECKRLHGLDPFWQFDEYLLKLLVGSEGQSLLKDAWCAKVLPAKVPDQGY